jgi:hypothetical protein
MDRSRIDAEHMVARYLAGQLSAADELFFEGYAANHPEIFREVESTLRLKEGLAVLHDRGELKALLRQGNRRAQFAAAAAAVLLLVTLGIWAWRHGPTRPLILASSAAEFATDPVRRLPIGDTVTLIRSRGQDAAVDLSLPTKRSAIRIRVLPSVFVERCQYRARLERVEPERGPAVVGEIDGLMAGEDRFVILYLDSSRLTPGEYAITLAGAGAGSEARAEADRFTVRMK